MLDLGPVRFRANAPSRPRPRTERRAFAPIHYPSGEVCDARCYYAAGDECTCPCGGHNHGAGLRCDDVTQEALL